MSDKNNNKIPAIKTAGNINMITNEQEEKNWKKK